MRNLIIFIVFVFFSVLAYGQTESSMQKKEPVSKKAESSSNEETEIQQKTPENKLFEAVSTEEESENNSSSTPQEKIAVPSRMEKIVIESPEPISY